jgi:hypothetical protein
VSQWTWVEVPPTGGADASTGAGIFKNWGDTSELLAREVIQNSWDAAQGYRDEDPSHDFEVVFRFDDLTGDRKAVFVDGLDLRQLFEQRVHLQREDSRARLEGSALGRLDTDDPLSVLYISDFGAHGLYGAPGLRRESHLYKALYTLGVSGKDDARLISGGSFGFGKGAFIRASRIGTVVAYSCFEPRPEPPYEDPVTRRLIGWTFWSGHEADGVERDGRAWFGVHGHPSSAKPYADQEADCVASLLGIHARDPADRSQLGTTLVLVDPTVHADDLCSAIEKYWWPAIEFVDGFATHVVTPDGTELHPRPKSRPDLRPFLKAYELASLNPAAAPAGPDHKIATLPDVDGLPTGTMAQVLDVPESESPPDLEADLAGRQTPIIAFMRRPRMVVEYREPSRARVPTRGVYIASDALDPYLKRTEPAGHEKWEMRSGDDDTDAERRAKGLALRAYRLIQDEVRSFAREAEPPRAVGGVPLGHFGELIGKFAGSGRGPVVPPIVDRLPISLVPTYDIEVDSADEDRIKLSGTVDVQSTDGESRQVRIWAVLAVREEDRVGAHIPIELEHLEGAQAVHRLPDGSLVVALDPDDRARFSIISEPYDHRWESRLAVNVEPVQASSASVSADEAV